MLDKKKVKLGIAPIGWTNDDMPDLGKENTFQQCVSEMALAGFTGSEVGGKYPTDVETLKKALDLRGIQICNCWFSSFLISRPYEETEKEFIFSSIKAFVDTTSTIKISKDELFEAIRLIEKRNYVLKKYDVDIFAVDNANMAAILYSLDSAYDLGVNDGYKKARQEVVDFITKGGH